MNKKRFGALLILAAMLLTLLTVRSFADDPSPAETTGAAADASTDALETTGSSSQDQEEEGGFFHKIISLKENGGLVTDVFGTKGTEIYADGTTRPTRHVAWTPYLLTLLLLAVFGYVLGSVNFGVIVSKKLYKEDVREHGSGNAGMTNVLRTYGKKAAILTLLGDMLKSSLSGFAGLMLAGNGGGYIAVAFCLIGHAFPMFFRFKGGKAVAATFGGLLVLEPLAAVLLFLCFAVIYAGTKYISLASIITATLIPLFVNAMWNIGITHNKISFDYFIVVICTVFYACFIIFLHRSNIKRLARGEERKTIIFKKKEKEDGSENS